MFEHCIQDGQQLTHASGQGYLFGFASGAQTLIERPDHGIVTSGDQGPHVQHGSNMSPSAPHGAFFPQGSAVSIEWLG